MRKLLFALLCLIGVMCSISAMAAEKNEPQFSDPYHYVILEDGTAEITRCDFVNIDPVLSIPSELDGYKVTKIGRNAFAESGWTDITIPEGVTTIDYNAFFKCENLTTLHIPDSVTDINEFNPFCKCFNLSRIDISPNHPTLAIMDDTLVRKSDMCLICPIGLSEQSAYIIPQGIEKIGASAFAYYKNLTSISIPDSVTAIGSMAFHCCDSLSDISIPDSVTVIGSAAFGNCISLTDILIPDSVTVIEGWNPFNYCTSLKEIRLSPDHPTLELVNGALISQPDKCLVARPCASDGSVYEIPQGIETISAYAFASNQNLTEIILPDSLTTIGNNAFAECDNLINITIPDSVNLIGEAAFAGCQALTEFTIPDGVEHIGRSTFLGCTGMTHIDIPGSVTSIEMSAFRSCKALTYIEIPDSVTKIGAEAFYYCPGLTSVVLPNSITSIGRDAFRHCDNLTSIVIPDSVTSIGTDAFKECPDELTVTVGRGSYTENYCMENGLNYINA